MCGRSRRHLSVAGAPVNCQFLIVFPGCARPLIRSRRPGAGVKVERPGGRIQGNTTLTPVRSGARWEATRRSCEVDSWGNSLACGCRSVRPVRQGGPRAPRLISVRDPEFGRRRDDQWGVPRRRYGRCGCSVFRGRPAPGCWRQCLSRSGPHGHQGGSAGRNADRVPPAGWTTGQPTGASASSPRARSRWWQRRAILRATDSAARCPPRRAATPV